MARKKYYMVVDTETATLPMAKRLCKDGAEMKKVAIAKPLVYDIGWVIMDRQGNIVKRENFLIQETFFVPDVFSTAYYREKRPIYEKLLKEGEVKRGTWDEVMGIFEYDIQNVDISVAYNAAFDFKKAIPYTERYIEALYGDYNKWERGQYGNIKGILENGSNIKREDFLDPYFSFRGNEYPIADLWAIACDRLINIDKYRNYCLENSYVTPSVQYFRTNAETCFQYLGKQYDFIEAHTALEDCLIEAQILAKALKKGKVEPFMEAFPFRHLGTTMKYVQEKKPKYKESLADLFAAYIVENFGDEKAEEGNRYWRRIVKYYNELVN